MSIFPHAPVHVVDRRPEAVGRGVSGFDLAMAQRTELHLDLSDELLSALAAGVPAAVSSCLECGHAAGCGCDCCPYDLPAVMVVPTERVVVHPPYTGAVDHVMTLAVYEVSAGGAR
jgi:hypothetical protein